MIRILIVLVLWVASIAAAAYCLRMVNEEESYIWIALFYISLLIAFVLSIPVIISTIVFVLVILGGVK